MVKRMIDATICLSGLVFLLPLLALVALLIRLDSAGPVFYRGTRVGRGGKLFRIIKFRTMVLHADKFGGLSTPEDDPRITRTGRVLRKYKLDELPQLINVVKGEMSIVGPRPEVLEYVHLYSQQERAILDVLPGITDFASIRFHNEGEILAGAADPEQAYMERIWPLKNKLRLKYAKNHSVRCDLRIVMETLKTLIGTRL